MYTVAEFEAVRDGAAWPDNVQVSIVEDDVSMRIEAHAVVVVAGVHNRGQRECPSQPEMIVTEWFLPNENNGAMPSSGQCRGCGEVNPPTVLTCRTPEALARTLSEVEDPVAEVDARLKRIAERDLRESIDGLLAGTLLPGDCKDPNAFGPWWDNFELNYTYEIGYVSSSDLGIEKEVMKRIAELFESDDEW